MSLFTELRRRNVFRVGIAYVVLAWLVLQVADVVLNNIEAPGWVFQTVLLLLALGLPFVLVFSWAFELTPEGLKRDHEVDRSESIAPQTGRKLDRATIVILVLAVCYFFWESRYATTGAPEKGVINITVSGETAVMQEAEAERAAQRPSGIEEATAISGRSVAVLPFVNMSPDPEQEYFSDGITEEIINAVVKIPGVSVPARTSVFGYKGRQGDVRQIGEDLGVAHILEGSIRSQGDQVRITAQLIKVADGFHLWSETFDRRLENIFAVQEEIARAIAGQLIGELGSDVATVPNRTDNMTAYDLYLQGRAALRDRTREAVTLLMRATEADPAFAPAWAALAVAHQSVTIDNAAAIGAAERALALDESNVDALTALGAAHRASLQWLTAERYFDRALAADPNSAELLEDYAEFLNYVGRAEEALKVTTRGLEIDPALTPLRAAHVEALAAVGRLGEARALARQTITARGPLNSDWSVFHAWLTFFPVWLESTGADGVTEVPPPPGIPPDTPDDVAQGIALLERASRSPDPATVAALKAALDPTQMGRYDSYWRATPAGKALLHLGETDFVIDTEIASIGKSPFGLEEWHWTPIYSDFRRHPRFQEYLERTGIVAYWDATAWPDACRRHEAGDIECR